MKHATALIVDDEPDIRELLEITLARMNTDTSAAADLQQARELLQQQEFDLCLTDMRLPDGDGLDLVEEIGRDFPQLPVAVITAHGSMDTAIKALKAGAFDFVSKPVNLAALRKLVSTALRLRSKAAQKDKRKNEIEFVGQSAAAQQVLKLVAKLARSQAPVYISGESGTGKELAARMIHLQGPRAQGPFIAVNCGAIPSELMESELFGHMKGSFTGAAADKQGLFQAAEGGTLFLDEIADLPLGMQVKLLRAIQEKSVRPVGGQQEIAVDVRIISATHKNLQTLVQNGDFRQDLYYRVNVIQLQIPPLRDRKEDIDLLVPAILQRISEDEVKLSAEALRALHEYSFPGNVRELENVLERSLALCDEQLIHESDLALSERSTAVVDTLVSVPVSVAPLSDSERSLNDDLDSMQKQRILDALNETRWNRTAAAKKLGITLRQLRYRLAKYHIE
ncbi:MAG: sigma-54 dependent transcriptional regulator [gamma proteobacterium symbiont of Bathyaustriella thionipta]|nr:sigma-54 dependent transcriptional regulator [gamma proteobacterium symbiont of Bathyaustriella thionipta]